MRGLPRASKQEALARQRACSMSRHSSTPTALVPQLDAVTRLNVAAADSSVAESDRK
jgi:hypothetical protein